MENPEEGTQSGQFIGQFKGRDGYVFFRESSREIKFYWELAVGAGIQICIGADFRKWTSGSDDSIPESKQLQILYSLREWLTSQNINSTIHLPRDLQEGTQRLPVEWM